MRLKECLVELQDRCTDIPGDYFIGEIRGKGSHTTTVVSQRQ